MNYNTHQSNNESESETAVVVNDFTQNNNYSVLQEHTINFICPKDSLYTDSHSLT